MKARLVNGTSVTGRLEVFLGGEWNTVCGLRFGSNEATVACRMLGFNSTGAAVRVARYGRGLGSSLSMTCVGTETSLSQCRQEPDYNYLCDHELDVGVICNITSSIYIESENTYPLLEGVKSVLECRSLRKLQQEDEYTWPETAGGVACHQNLIFDNLTSAHHGRPVRCVASYRSNGSRYDVSSDVLELQVYYYPNIKITRSDNPGIPLAEDSNHTLVTLGHDVTFQCEADSNPPPASITWSGNVNSSTGDLQIPAAADPAAHGGVYTCTVVTGTALSDHRLPLTSSRQITVVVTAESPSDQPEDNTGVIAGAAIAGAAVVGLSATSAVLFWKRRKKERLLLEKGKEGESSRQQNDEDLEEETYVEIHDVSDQAALAAGGDVYGYTEIDNGVGSIRQKKPPLPNRGATDTQNMHNGDNPYDQANSSSEDITPGPSAKPSRKTSHKPSSTEAPYEVCRETETTQQRPASSETSSEESPISSSPSSKSNESEGYTYPGSRDSKKHTKYLTPMPSSPGLEKKGSTSLANTDVSYLTPALEGSGASPTTDVTRADNSLSGQEKSQADYYLTPASEKTPADYYLTPVSGEGQGHSTDSTKEDYYLTPRSVEGSMQLASEDAIPAVEYMPVLAPSLLPEELNTEMMKAGYLTPVHIQSSLQTAEAEKDASHSSDSLKKAGYLTPVDVPGSPVTSQMLAKSEPSSGISKTSSYTTPVEVPGSPVTSKSQGKDTQSSDIKKPQDYLTPGSASPPKKEKKKSSMIPLAEFWSSKRLSPNRKSPSSSEGEPEAPHPYEKISSVKHMDPSNDPSYRRIGDVIMTEQTNSDTPNYQNC